MRKKDISQSELAQNSYEKEDIGVEKIMQTFSLAKQTIRYFQ